MSKSNKKPILLVLWLVILGGLLFGITHFNSAGGTTDGGGKAPPEPHAPTPAVLAKRWPEIVAHAAAPARGNPQARYTIAEFGDFQCPQCGKARPLLEKLLAQYPSQVNLIFVHRPFPNIHHWAIPASTAAQIAASEGKFWPMYDALYSHQDDLEPGFYVDYAAQIGLNKAQFQAAFTRGDGQQAVADASKFSDSLGIQETPTLVLYDSVQKTATPYVGLKGGDGTGALGIQDLVARPPWAAASAKKQA